MNYKLETHPGGSIDQVAKEAKKIAQREDVTVEFEFNEVTVLVDKDTFVDNLVRTYMDAHIMKWKTIGPKYHWEYDVDTQIELYTRKLERAKQRKIADEEAKVINDKKEAEVKKLTEGIELDIIPELADQYRDHAEKNSHDGYSKCCIDYGESWMKLMQIEIAKGRPVSEIASETQKPLDFYGITGFMYGCILSTLSHFWKHGEEVRVWHNNRFGVGADKKGTVNPAILTISTK